MHEALEAEQDTEGYSRLQQVYLQFLEEALLLVTEIRVRAEQKGVVSVETDANRLKCLRRRGTVDDWVQVGSRFPRLTAPQPLVRLREILVFLKNLPNP